MEGCSPRWPPPSKQAWKMYVALGVAVVVLMAAAKNLCLAEARGHWNSYRQQLGALERKVSELEREFARVTQLQQGNEVFKAKVTQEQEQLGDPQSRRVMQNQLLQKLLQGMKSPHSGGHRLPAVSPSLLALLLPGMLLL